MSYRDSPLSAILRYGVPILAIAFLLRFLLLEEEEEEEGAGLVGKYDGRRKDPPAGTLPHERDYLDSVYELLSSYSRHGRQRLRRFYVMMMISLASAAAVPVAVAANMPGWTIASLGAVAAVCQGGQQLLQDHRIGVECHAMAVALSRAIQRFHLEAGDTTEYRQRAVFHQLVDAVEQVQDTHGPMLLEVLRQVRTPPANP